MQPAGKAPALAWAEPVAPAAGLVPSLSIFTLTAKRASESMWSGFGLLRRVSFE